MYFEYSDEGEQRALYEALTRHNYFPNQRVSIGELPPSLSTRQYTPEVVEALVKTGKVRGSGYDLVEYRATRYNNVPRILGIIHPKAYAFLAKCIHDNWNELKTVTINRNSIIKPEFHYEDERLIVMNYEHPSAKIIRSNSMSFAKKYRAHADIANCFNSIYTHAIPWAAVGVQQAKAQKNDKNAWFNELDFYQRKIKRNETLGVPIGSVTSSIVVELILKCVDTKLNEKNYSFYRYVDDYVCYCKSEDEADCFLSDLGNFLKEYKLTLNLKKTKIESLPMPEEDDWVLELRSILPVRQMDEEASLTVQEALTFLNRAVLINESTPDGSVLKYAMSLIIPYIEIEGTHALLGELLNLSWHYPILLPFVDILLNRSGLNAEVCKIQLLEIIKENAIKKRSDGMAWPLHTLLTHSISADSDTIDLVIESADCVAITLLLEMKGASGRIVDFAKDIVGSSDDYEKDEYWLLLYQLFFKDLIPEPYNDGAFKCLKKHNVNFIPGDSISNGEMKCTQAIEKIRHDFVAEAFSDIDDLDDPFANPDCNS